MDIKFFSLFTIILVQYDTFENGIHVIVHDVVVVVGNVCKTVVQSSVNILKCHAQKIDQKQF